MTDDLAVGMPTRGWSAIGGRVIPPSAGEHAAQVAPRRAAASDLKGHLSFATSDGLLGPGRRLRYRRARWARVAFVWAALVLLVPLGLGWAWGVVGSLLR